MIPLSDLIDLTGLAMNLLKTWINESVSNALVTSMWTALLGKHINRAQYLFKSDLLSLMVYGSSISTPQCVNGGTSRHLTLGKSAIFCTPNLQHSLRQLTHLYIIPLTTVLTLSIQNSFCFKLFKVIPLPPRAKFSWHHQNVASDMLLCFGRTKGWASLRENLDFPNLPPTHNKPSPSKNGSSL